MDPQAVGRELSVSDVFSGHFLREGDRLQVTLEVMDTESNRVLWRDTLGAKAGDLIGLREQITAHLRQGLFPVFTASSVKETSSAPSNPEAYDLFLRASALSRDPHPNKQALAMLARAVKLDPSYAPAWNALARREYYDGGYSDGGPAAMERARSAHEGPANRSEPDGRGGQAHHPAGGGRRSRGRAGRRFESCPAASRQRAGPFHGRVRAALQRSAFGGGARMRRGPGARSEGPGLAFLRHGLRAPRRLRPCDGLPPARRGLPVGDARRSRPARAAGEARRGAGAAAQAPGAQRGPAPASLPRGQARRGRGSAPAPDGSGFQRGAGPGAEVLPLRADGLLRQHSHGPAHAAQIGRGATTSPSRRWTAIRCSRKSGALRSSPRSARSRSRKQKQLAARRGAP